MEGRPFVGAQQETVAPFRNRNTQHLPVAARESRAIGAVSVDRVQMRVPRLLAGEVEAICARQETDATEGARAAHPGVVVLAV